MSERRTRGTSVVLGARTRLGEAVLERLLREGEPVVVVARDERDRDLLLADPRLAAGSGPAASTGRTSGEPSVRVVLAEHFGDTLEPLTGPLRVLVLALGPVHPTDAGVEPPLESDMSAVTRDLAVVDAALAAAGGGHVVLVSTVLALAPQHDRRYYGGWKNVVEQSLRARTEARGGVLSVLYPGRLVGPGDRGRLSTSYARLADTTLATAPASTQRVVGTDSRILLIVRSIQFVLRSLRPMTSHRSPTETTRSERRPPR